MAQTAMTIRIDEQDKVQFTQLCSEFGMSVNTAINIFIKKVINVGAIPFNIGLSPQTKSVDDEAIEAWRAIRRRTMSSDEPEMTLDEINALINEVRNERTAKSSTL